MQKQVIYVALLAFTTATLHAVKIINNSNEELIVEPLLWQFPNLHSNGRSGCGPALISITLPSEASCDEPKLESVSISSCYIIINLQEYHILDYKGKDPQECDIKIDATKVPSGEQNPQAARIVTYDEFAQHHEKQEEKREKYWEKILGKKA